MIDKFKSLLRNNYKINIMQIYQQNGGWASLAYKVITPSKTYFLKVYEKKRASTPKWTSLIDDYIPIVLWLNDNTKLCGKIINPISTNEGRYKSEDEDNIYILFEYIKGETIGEKLITENQIVQISEIITELHKYDEHIPVSTVKIKEDFSLPFCVMLNNFIENEYINCTYDVKNILSPYIIKISEIIKQVEKLSFELKNSNLKYVLCHTDIHNWNMMQNDHLILIDWEGLKLAPPEADLFMLMDKPYWKSFFEIYSEIHKDYKINWYAIEFYKLRRKTEDLWEWIEQLQYDIQDADSRKQTLKSLHNECITL